MPIDITALLKALRGANSNANAFGANPPGNNQPMVSSPIESAMPNTGPMAKMAPGTDVNVLRQLGSRAYTQPVNENQLPPPTNPGGIMRDIASDSVHLNNPRLSPDVRLQIAQKVINNYRIMGADLPNNLKNYDPTKLLSEQVPPPFSTGPRAPNVQPPRKVILQPKEPMGAPPEQGSDQGMKINPLDALKIDPDKLLE